MQDKSLEMKPSISRRSRNPGKGMMSRPHLISAISSIGVGIDPSVWNSRKNCSDILRISL
jgi:hypothetical protein